MHYTEHSQTVKESAQCVDSFSMTMSKPFKTYEEQIEILKNRGLIIDDDGKTIRCLEKENYYSVINGYKEPFIIAGSENFVEKTYFDYINRLYSFDKSLRHSLLSILLDIETTLKSIISYEFAKEFGECAYLDESSYNTYDPKSKQNTKNLISIFCNEINDWKNQSDTTYDNIKHYLDIHHEIPVWVLFSHLKLRDLSKFYTALKPSTKKSIVKRLIKIYGHPFSTGDLYNFFRILCNIRNLCAHNLRIYNYKTVYQISPQNQFVNTILQNYGTDIKYNNLIAVAIIIYHLSDEQQFSLFFNGFIVELKSLLDIPPEFAVRIYGQQNFSLFTFINILIKMAQKPVE